MATTGTITTLTDFNDIDEVTFVDATTDTAGGDEDYVFTPTKAESKGLLIVKSTDNASSAGVTITVSAGDGFAAAGSDLSLTLTADKTMAVVLDGAYKNSDGQFEVNFDPANDGDKLVTNHALTAAFVEIP